MAIENSDTDSSGNIRIRMRALQPKLQEAHPDLWTKFAWANFPSVVPILPPSAVLHEKTRSTCCHPVTTAAHKKTTSALLMMMML